MNLQVKKIEKAVFCFLKQFFAIDSFSFFVIINRHGQQENFTKREENENTYYLNGALDEEN